jgi:transcriptional regulator with XRE-family HTH domain
MTVRELAEHAGVSAMTVTRFENERTGGYAVTVAALQLALEAVGVTFVPATGDGPGVRLHDPEAE